jgi:meiotically up-regulated gene 157 (Mug157) protein
MGSPHTSSRFAWALGIYTEVLTATTPEEKAAGLRTLLKLQCGDGLMHESVHVDNLKQCTRKWFEVGGVGSEARSAVLSRSL